MSDLKLIKSEYFGNVECDFYGKSGEVYMTISQLAECLGYASKSGVENIISRHEYLKKPEFSGTYSLWVPNGNGFSQQKTRIFTEDGIYEVTMLAKTERAKEFRSWVRTVLKALRTGKTKLVGMTEYQQMMAETRRRNARVQSARILTQLAKQYHGTTYEQVLNAHATKELTGEYLLPLPRLETKTYSAGEIGEILGISGNKVGAIANQNGLKNDKYGQWFKDKAKWSNKEVPAFRYYDNVIPVLRKILDQEKI